MIHKHGRLFVHSLVSPCIICKGELDRKVACSETAASFGFLSYCTVIIIEEKSLQEFWYVPVVYVGAACINSWTNSFLRNRFHSVLLLALFGRSLGCIPKSSMRRSNSCRLKSLSAIEND